MNVFIPGNAHRNFTWDKLGDIKRGRNGLGEEMPVWVYRLLHASMRDVLSKTFGEKQADLMIRDAGRIAGVEYAKNVLDLTLEFDAFIKQLKQSLKVYKIGVLCLESFEPHSGEIVLTISEDLNCSGLPTSDETVCYYEEGFIAGILELYTGNNYDVREIDCWANGNRVCRFKGESKKPE